MIPFLVAVLLYTTPLQMDYARFNRVWFDNKLASDYRVRYVNSDDMPDEYAFGGFAIHYANAMGVTEPSTHTIYINKENNPVVVQARLTLLHEMCHVKNELRHDRDFNEEDRNHGRVFQACMLDLAKRGAFHDLW